ncbi:DUF1963 domain-containing protein [Marisediminicola sp. LYQ85]|uniref:DUF1963 domain-containing protein n=1 Tax=Marisediminicola sp. LYQ85 TaxID=3391062 RepID=UPI0039835760
MNGDSQTPDPVVPTATVSYHRASQLKGSTSIRLQLEQEHLIESRVSVFSAPVFVDGQKLRVKWGNTLRFSVEDAGVSRACVLVTEQGKDGWPATVPRVVALLVDEEPVRLKHEPLRDDTTPFDEQVVEREPEPEPATPAPIAGGRTEFAEWLESEPYGIAHLAARLEPRAVLTERGLPPGIAGLHTETFPVDRLSLLGGPAVGITAAEWPRNANGTRLAHVATLSLTAVNDALEAAQEGQPGGKPGLPATGVLQIFHDLTETYGWEPADCDARGWVVRWLENPDFAHLTDSPDDVDLPTAACQAYAVVGCHSIPSSMEFADESFDVFDAVERAGEEINRAWTRQRTGDPDAAVVPVTHLFGHSQSGVDGDVSAVLSAALPLTAAGDEHRLIVDIESWTTLDAWFGDAKPLEVWMRQSDLEARAFDQAWCLIRTDA